MKRRYLENKKKSSFLTYEKMSDINIPHKLFFFYISHILILIVILFFLWKVSSYIWYGALIGQSIITILAILPVMYVTKKSYIIRREFKKKYGELAFRHLYYRYIFITQIPTFISFYFPILLKTDYFLPQIISLSEHYMTDTILPIYIALPLCLLLIIIGFLIRIPSGGFNVDVESYIYLIYPEKSKMIDDGLYRFIRHPRYMSRVFIALGFGIFANNGIAICASIIHFIPFLLLIKIEDDELAQRFGERFKEYRRSVPALIPHLHDLRKFVKAVFRLK